MTSNSFIKINIKNETCIKLHWFVYLLKVWPHKSLSGRAETSTCRTWQYEVGHSNCPHKDSRTGIAKCWKILLKRDTQKNDYGLLLPLSSMWHFIKSKGMSNNCKHRVYKVVLKCMQSSNIRLETIFIDLWVGHGKFWFVILFKLCILR